MEVISSWPVHHEHHDNATVEDLDPELHIRIASLLERSYDKAALRLSCKLWKKVMDAAHTYVPFTACKLRPLFFGQPTLTTIYDCPPGPSRVMLLDC
jgi:hypothetical protein